MGLIGRVLGADADLSLGPDWHDMQIQGSKYRIPN